MIDTNKIPQYSIDLKDLKSAVEICQLMRKASIESYCYAFEYRRETMKYGLQYDIIKSQYGERAYRQAWNIPGWDSVPLSSSGQDMLGIVENFPSIHKDAVTLHIWDMTNYPRASSLKPNFEVDKLERQLIKDHISRYGEAPVGNKNLEEHMDYATYIPDSVMNLFEEVQSSIK
jgi:hypothetical protein